MNLLFKREQTSGKFAKVAFKLWGKLELDENEQALVKRYRFDDAILIYWPKPGLLKRSVMIGAVVGIVALWLISNVFGSLATGLLLGAIVGGGVGYWFYDNNRETIFVKDLLHGRHFICESIVQLAKQEAFQGDAVAFLRQVMESAKHWDGTETTEVPVLPKDEARQFIIQYG